MFANKWETSVIERLNNTIGELLEEQLRKDRRTNSIYREIYKINTNIYKCGIID